jgi:hypothetical protein
MEKETKKQKRKQQHKNGKTQLVEFCDNSNRYWRKQMKLQDYIK